MSTYYAGDWIRTTAGTVSHIVKTDKDERGNHRLLCGHNYHYSFFRPAGRDIQMCQTCERIQHHEEAIA